MIPHINAFTCLTKDDCWIAGSYINDQNQRQMFFQHFKNGKWSLVSAPPVRNPSNISDIAAISARDIWAVGSSTTDIDYPQGFTAPTPLIEHWDGQHWSVIDTHLEQQVSLRSISILSPKDIWIRGVSVGYGYDHHYGLMESSRPLSYHFDGLRWKRFTHPDTKQPDNDLRDMKANTTNDVWAVGVTYTTYTHFTEGYSSVIEHFDGEKWNIVPSMNLGTDQYAYNTNNTSLSALSIINSRDIWAVGEVAEHWDGIRWSIVSFPPHSHPNLNTVIALGPKDVWAGNENTFYHWNGLFWKPAPLSPGISQLQNWQRFGKTNTLIGLGTYQDQTYIITLN